VRKRAPAPSRLKRRGIETEERGTRSGGTGRTHVGWGPVWKRGASVTTSSGALRRLIWGEGGPKIRKGVLTWNKGGGRAVKVPKKYLQQAGRTANPNACA